MFLYKAWLERRKSKSLLRKRSRLLNFLTKSKTVDVERLVTLKKLKDEAMDEIHRCSAYVFSGRDKAFGRVFELSRTEWCDYYIALEYCEKKPDSPIPKQPSRQSEPN